MFKLITLATILAACGAQDTSSPVGKTELTTTLYTCHTIASCDATTAYAEHALCAGSSSTDYGNLGEQAAEDWIAGWKATCIADQGIVDGTVDSDKCLVPGTEEHAPFGCEAWCEPTYEACP